MKSRVLALPKLQGDFAKETRKTYWKQILPQARINYTTKNGKRSVLDFDEKYLANLIDAFNSKALDQTPFLLADADNRHTMDPERWRGEVAEMRLAHPGEKPGLYAKLVFPSAAAAKAVVANPNLGVSARIREGITTSDGKTYPAGIIHVLGTLDPQVTGMSGWQPVDLANVLDLSNESFSEEMDMAKFNGKDVEAITEEDIDAMTDEEVAEFLQTVAPEYLEAFEDEEVEDEEDEGLEDEPVTPVLSGAGANLSNRMKHDLELANAQSALATSRANEALRRAAEAEWKEYRAQMVGEGVPPHLLDLAEPVLNRADDMVIDLSNADEADINVSKIVREVLEASKGLVDLSAEAGHYRMGGSSEDDPDKEYMDLWAAQYGGPPARTTK